MKHGGDGDTNGIQSSWKNPKEPELSRKIYISASPYILITLFINTAYRIYASFTPWVEHSSRELLATTYV